MRYRFSDVFTQNSDGSLTPLRPISGGGASMSQGGIIWPGFPLGSLDIHSIAGQDIEAEEVDGVLRITGAMPK